MAAARLIVTPSRFVTYYVTNRLGEKSIQTEIGRTTTGRQVGGADERVRINGCEVVSGSSTQAWVSVI